VTDSIRIDSLPSLRSADRGASGADRLRRGGALRSASCCDDAQPRPLSGSARRQPRSRELRLLVATDATGTVIGTVSVARPSRRISRIGARSPKMLVHRRARRLRAWCSTGLSEPERLAYTLGKTLLVLDTASGMRNVSMPPRVQLLRSRSRLRAMAWRRPAPRKSSTSIPLGLHGARVPGAAGIGNSAPR